MMYEIVLTVRGHIKTTNIFSPTKYAGWLRHLAKQYAIRSGAVPVETFVKAGRGYDILRIYDPVEPTRMRKAFYALVFHPINQLFGYPSTTLSVATSVLGQDGYEVYKMLRPARIRIVVTPVQSAQSYIKQGVRDDYTPAVTNPHDLNLIELKQPVKIQVFVQTEDIDQHIIPRFLGDTVPRDWHGKTYITTYDAILKGALEIARKEKISPFGGRKYHTVSIDFKATGSPPALKPVPFPDRVEQLLKDWRKDYSTYRQSILRQAQQTQQREGWSGRREKGRERTYYF